MDTKRARTFLFWFFIGAASGLLIIVGHISCTQLDKALSDANTIAETTQTVIDSPAGQLAPPDIKLYASLGASAVLAAAAAYKQWRLSQMSKTTKAIVRGIESADLQPLSEGQGNPSGSVKPAIAAEMRKLSVYDAGNKIVDRIKND